MMVHFVTLPSAKETADAVLRNIFHLHSFPSNIVSDQGPQFISCFWKEICSMEGASVGLSLGYHPESNGQTKSLNQELDTGLRCLVLENPSLWSRLLMWVEYARNSLPRSSTGMSPFQCVFGNQPPLFPAVEREVSVPSPHGLVHQNCRAYSRCRPVEAS